MVSLTADPGPPEVLWVATDHGLFRSADGGTSWQAGGTGLPATYVMGIRRAPDGALYAGTNRGIFKSTDRGASWQFISSEAMGPVGTPAIDPTNPAVLYAGSRLGAFQSIDGGATWRALENGPKGGTVTSFAILPSNPRTLYASVEGQGVFRTDDAGETWTKRNQGLVHTVVDQLILHASDPPVLYAALGSSSPRMGGFCRSIDGGATWQDVSAGLPNEAVWRIIVSPNDPRRIYAGTAKGVYVLDQLIALSPATSVTPLPRAAAPIATEKPAGPRWEYLGLSGDSAVRAIAIDPQHPSTIYVAAVSEHDNERGGLFKSTDGGRNWRRLSVGSQPPWSIALDPRLPSTLYAAVMREGIRKTIDGGGTWRDANAGLTRHLGLLPSVGDVIVEPARPSTVYAVSSSGLFKSIDGGQRWRPALVAPPALERVFAHPQRPDVVLALDGTGKLHRSSDAAARWTQMKVPEASRVDVIAFGTSETVYAAGEGVRFRREGMMVLSDRVVLRSDDGGLGWHVVASWPPERRVLTLLADRRDPSRLLAGRRGAGVHQSRDGGATWDALNEGLTNQFVTVLANDGSNPSTVYAGTDGGGVFVLRRED